MAKQVLPPTAQHLKITGLLTQAIHRFIAARSTLSPETGRYESDLESIYLMNLVMRNTEGVITLAESDLILFPGALNVTRAVLEISMKALWMLSPKDPFEREIRWLAQLQTEEEYYDRFAKRMSQMNVDSTMARESKSTIAAFRADVISVLPKQYAPLPQIPDLASMMRDIGEEKRYLEYIHLSQFAHGTHVATRMYRKGLGIY